MDSVNYLLIYLIGYVAWFICLVVLILLLLSSLKQNRELAKLHQSMLEQMSKQETQRVSLLMTSNRQLLDKALGLVATNDPLAFQAIQAMGQPSAYNEPTYDPSDEAEFARLESMGRGVGEDLSGEELGLLSDIANVAPELFYPDGTPTGSDS